MSVTAHRLLLARATAAMWVFLCAAIVIDVRTSGGPLRRPEVIFLNDNGAWSWFEDERAVVDAATGTLVVSSVADASGTGGATRDGNVEVVAYDLATGITNRAVLHAHLEADDHDSAALYVRADGSYLAMFSSHAADTLTRWRLSAAPGSATSWLPEQVLDHGSAVTYSNVYAADGGTLDAFVRAAGRDPHILVSEDDGATWRNGGRLLQGPGRPYVRYAADGAGRIHVLAAEQHPLDVPTSIYHGVVDGRRLLRSDGEVVDADLTDLVAVVPQRLTRMFDPAGDARAWPIDLQTDARGRPHGVFSVHRSAADDTYWYAWFDGSAWHSHFLAGAGSALSRAEPYYTGLVALDPADPRHVVISTDLDPRNGAKLVSATDGRRHHELFGGVTSDGGANWAWTPITIDSVVDNVRPVIPVWDADHVALVWLRGRYTNYDDYDLDVVAVVADLWAIRPVQPDATTAALARTGASVAPRSGARRRSCRRR
jgi:BNR repeat-containing family member